MKAKAGIFIVVVVAIGFALGWILNSSPVPPPQTETSSAAAPTQNVAVAVKEISRPEKLESSNAPPPSQTAPRHNAANRAPLQPAGPFPQPLVINGYEVQDPIARVAVNFVGADPDAEAYWIGAINNSAMPPEERKDLIEDLNENGLSNPQHPAAADLPLILARIRLIERLAPNAMDEVNRDAFAEAYKDLVAMANGQAPQ